MKLFLVLVLVFSSHLTFSRELNPKEKIAVFGLGTVQKNKRRAEEKLRGIRLTIRERVMVETAKRGCLPLKILWEQIQRANDEFPDQTLNVFTLQKSCSDSAHFLMDLYFKKSEN